MRILVTGGAGYIGSHTCVELLEQGYEVVVVDNLCNSSRQAVERVEEISGKALTFYKDDLLDSAAMEMIFRREKIDAVIHFAGLKAVGESVRIPLDYYYNNITGTLNLCRVMQAHGVKNIVFSSSATVYGLPESVPVREDFPLAAVNPYGRTKLMLEKILTDLQAADPEWNVMLLRYFNPVGAHKSGLIGESPRGIPNNLMPYITQVAAGRLPYLNVFGSDYETPDGSGVRDYIHVVDLALGHIKALEKMEKGCGLKIYNLGTGKGYSVLEMIRAFEQASGQPIPYKLMPRRPGDIAINFADPSKAKAELGWTASRTLADMCEDAWRWQQNNPDGYEE